MENDGQLIHQFNDSGGEQAFAALVKRHVNMVFATAIRQLGDFGVAEEVTQNVFIALAQSAGKLGRHPTLAGWLYQTTLNKTRQRLRSEIRRQRREKIAVKCEEIRMEGDSVWSSVVPLLDEALSELHEPDRLAVIMHFMESHTFGEVGATLGVGEDAARKRVQRCLDQLTRFFRQRGFAVPALAAGAPLFVMSLQAAPARLTKSAVAAGLKAGSMTAGSSTSTLIKGVLKLMAWTKAKTAIVAGVVVLLAVGATPVIIKEFQSHTGYPWRVGGFNGNVLAKAPPLLAVLPSQIPYGSCGTSGGKFMGTGVSAQTVVEAAYADQDETLQTVVLTELPSGKYDFIASYPSGNGARLREEVKRKFDVVARHETRDGDVLLLKVKYSGAPSLKASDPSRLAPHTGSSSKGGPGYFSARNVTLSGLAFNLNGYFKLPIIDQTGLTDHFDADLKWDEPDPKHPNLETMKQAVLDQLGLELVPATEPIETLVVEKAK